MFFLKVKTYIILLLAGFLFASFFVLSAQAQNNNYGLDESAAKIPAFQSQLSEYDQNFLNTRVGSIIGIVLSFIGVLFLILMLYAGILWMTASGNDEKVKKAKDLIINAIIGLIIVSAAYAITAFIGERLL